MGRGTKYLDIRYFSIYPSNFYPRNFETVTNKTIEKLIVFPIAYEYMLYFVYLIFFSQFLGKITVKYGKTNFFKIK